MYALQLPKLLETIRESQGKKILIQLPDGLKPKAGEIVDYVESRLDVQVFIWFGTCYGACDIPQNLKPLGIDLTIQYGHNRYNKTEEW